MSAQRQDAFDSFFSAKALDDLALTFGISKQHLAMLAFSDKDFYRTFRTPKKSGKGFRTISVPRSDLKELQRFICDALSSRYQPPKCVHGFTEGRNVASNAIQHVRKQALLNIDLEDFFPSITAPRVHGLFLKRFGFPSEAANILTNLVCYQGSLPQGAPSSPIISNIICYALDRDFISYAARNHITYSRYADDLVFSATSRYLSSKFFDRSDSGIDAVSAYIKETINRNGFRINEQKIHFASKGTRLTVTGIVVNQKCNFQRNEYRTLRVLFNNWKKHGLEYATAKYVEHFPSYRAALSSDDELVPQKLPRHIRGRLAYYTMIVSQNGRPTEPLVKLWTMYHDITKESVPYLTYEKCCMQLSVSYDWDSSGKFDCFAEDGSAFLYHGYLLTCRHCIIDGNSIPINQMDADIEAIMPDGSRNGLSFAQFSFYHDYDFAFAKQDNLIETAALEIDFDYLPQPGERVIACGYTGESKRATVVSAMVENAGRDSGLARVDRAFIHGMSGCPVFNANRKVIGIVVKGSDGSSYSKNGEYLPLHHLKDREPFRRLRNVSSNA